MAVGGTKVIQVTNIAPQATKDQMQTLFGYLGKIEDIRLYPTIRDVSCPVQSRICYVKFVESVTVGIAQHMTNTVFIDRALIVIPIQSGDIPDEYYALEMTKNGAIVPGLCPQEPKLPPNVVNTVVATNTTNGSNNEQPTTTTTMMMTTSDPQLEVNGLPPYPALPANYDARKVEEIRRTVLVPDIASSTADDVLSFVKSAGEVKYLRFCTRTIDDSRHCLIEFSDQPSVIEALKLDGTELNGRKTRVLHSVQAIVKPQAKSNEAAQREIEEAMSRVKEAQSLISAAIDPVIGMLSKEKRVGGGTGAGGGIATTVSGGGSRRSRSRSRGGGGSGTAAGMSGAATGGSTSARRRRTRSPSSRRSRSRSRHHKRSRSRRSPSRSRSRDARRRRRSRSSRRRHRRRRRSTSSSRSSRRTRSRSGARRSRSKSRRDAKRSRERSRDKKDNKRDEVEAKDNGKDHRRGEKKRSRSRSSRYRSRSRDHRRGKRRRSASKKREESRSPSTASRKHGKRSRSKERNGGDGDGGGGERSGSSRKKERKERHNKEERSSASRSSKVSINYDEEEKSFDSDHKRPASPPIPASRPPDAADNVATHAADKDSPEKSDNMDISNSP